MDIGPWKIHCCRRKSSDEYGIPRKKVLEPKQEPMKIILKDSDAPNLLVDSKARLVADGSEGAGRGGGTGGGASDDRPSREPGGGRPG
uniref:Uncharacterized protein n=1 Tax=Physcomitrium patens TaxID=3218 RepID=A0A2K1KN19_PHYPA|nr:hypothetical protein PHYPA_006068 [Physcomitrium patens]